MFPCFKIISKCNFVKILKLKGFKISRDILKEIKGGKREKTMNEKNLVSILAALLLFTDGGSSGNLIIL